MVQEDTLRGRGSRSDGSGRGGREIEEERREHEERRGEERSTEGGRERGREEKRAAALAARPWTYITRKRSTERRGERREGSQNRRKRLCGWKCTD